MRIQLGDAGDNVSLRKIELLHRSIHLGKRLCGFSWEMLATTSASERLSCCTFQSTWARGFVRIQLGDAGDNISLRKIELLRLHSLAQ